MTTSTSTASVRPKCQHKNGWYVLVKFWIFSRNIFVCSDCGKHRGAWFDRTDWDGTK